jgi:hypothetical protein
MVVTSHKTILMQLKRLHSEVSILCFRQLQQTEELFFLVAGSNE